MVVVPLAPDQLLREPMSSAAWEAAGESYVMALRFSADFRHRQGFASLGLKANPHFHQGRNDATHRTLLKRLVARDLNANVPWRQNTHKKSRSGARVSAVDGAFGLLRAFGTPPGNATSQRTVNLTLAETFTSSETAPMVERTSAESRTPVKREVPSAIAANSTARWDMDLSPGTRAAPSRGAPKGSMRVLDSLTSLSHRWG